MPVGSKWNLIFLKIPNQDLCSGIVMFGTAKIRQKYGRCDRLCSRMSDCVTCKSGHSWTAACTNRVTS